MVMNLAAADYVRGKVPIQTIANERELRLVNCINFKLFNSVSYQYIYLS